MRRDLAPYRGVQCLVATRGRFSTGNLGARRLLSTTLTNYGMMTTIGMTKGSSHGLVSKRISSGRLFIGGW